ncbi:Thiol-specific monooxygenase [Lachnellula willkommii]|uniref:Thiol-specific monooxygenase n=1 Tax=Lachnellula willkommii TaxID=215461 RepID=A0A559MLC9_9HELO|nr:Thiol-specific monooxygenase [Lachnellula willkommii]
MAPINFKSVAIIGAGPAGIISIDALAQEQAFDHIRVFERREAAGGCWIEDPEDHVQQLPDLKKIAERRPDDALPIPQEVLSGKATTTPKNTQTPLYSVVRGRYHPYFFDFAFQHPNIVRRPSISRVESNPATNERTIFFEDGTKLEDVDYIIFGTGYTWTLPFLPDIDATIRNNRLPNLYQHVFWREDPSLVFVGAVAAGFTFKVFEWQAVLAARFLAGRITLPPVSEQVKWEEDRIAYKGDGVPFTALYPDFEEYFEVVRKMAGEPQDGKGRPLPKFEKWWRDNFDNAHLKRIAMWKRGNEEAREKKRRESGKPDGAPQSSL